nr:VanZ family protein [candidate division Zixibacteria bacterium]
MRNFFIYHLPAIAYAALIIILSSIPDLGKNSFDIFKLDKIIHFIEYAVFAILVFRSISHLMPNRVILILGISLVLVAMFAMFDEFYQSYIPGRHSDPFDWLFDFLGATLIIVFLHYRLRKRRAMHAAE